MAAIVVNILTESNRYDELLQYLKDIHPAALKLDIRLYRTAWNAFLDVGLEWQLRSSQQLQVDDLNGIPKEDVSKLLSSTSLLMKKQITIIQERRSHSYLSAM
ncbi:hypothetical protein SUGI_0612930 [Cryptomeria japonica]|nr:hypothetical protein SUGI_0612930 [Cryptomeria japonica]